MLLYANKSILNLIGYETTTQFTSAGISESALSKSDTFAPSLVPTNIMKFSIAVSILMKAQVNIASRFNNSLYYFIREKQSEHLCRFRAFRQGILNNVRPRLFFVTK